MKARLCLEQKGQGKLSNVKAEESRTFTQLEAKHEHKEGCGIDQITEQS
jgi:hypothetical protein